MDITKHEPERFDRAVRSACQGRTGMPPCQWPQCGCDWDDLRRGINGWEGDPRVPLTSPHHGEEP